MENNLLNGTYTLRQLAEHHGLDKMPNKDQKRLLASKYIMKKSGADYIVEPRLGFEDFDWDTNMYDMNEVKKHLGSTWQFQFEKHNYEYTIKDGYIDANVKEEVQEMIVNNSGSITNNGTINIYNGNKMNGNVIDAYETGEGIHGFVCISRFNYDAICLAVRDEKEASSLMQCAIAIIMNMSWNNYIVKLNYTKLEQMVGLYKKEYARAQWDN